MRPLIRIVAVSGSCDRGARREDARAWTASPRHATDTPKKPAPLLRVSRLRVPHQLRVVRRRKMPADGTSPDLDALARDAPSRSPRVASRPRRVSFVCARGSVAPTPLPAPDRIRSISRRGRPRRSAAPRPRARPAPIPPTPTLTPPRSIAHHSLPCRCGNDPYAAGGYGMTGQGDHHEGNPFSPHAYSVNGIGKVKLLDTSTDAYDATDTDSPAKNQMWMGQNTVFTKQFRIRAAACPTPRDSARTRSSSWWSSRACTRTRCTASTPCSSSRWSLGRWT